MSNIISQFKIDEEKKEIQQSFLFSKETPTAQVQTKKFQLPSLACWLPALTQDFQARMCFLNTSQPPQSHHCDTGH